MSSNTNISVVVSQQIHVVPVQRKETVDVESETFQDKLRKFQLLSSAGRTVGNSNSNNNRLIQQVLDVGVGNEDSCKKMRRHRKAASSTQHPYKLKICYVEARKLLKPVDFKYSPSNTNLGEFERKRKNQSGVDSHNSMADEVPTKKVNTNNSNNTRGETAGNCQTSNSGGLPKDAAIEVGNGAAANGVDGELCDQIVVEKPTVTGYPVTVEIFNIMTVSSKIKEGCSNKYNCQVVGFLEDDAVPGQVLLEGNFIGTQQVNMSGRKIVQCDVTSSSGGQTDVTSGDDVTSGGLSAGEGAASDGNQESGDDVGDSEPSTSGCVVDSGKKF